MEVGSWAGSTVCSAMWGNKLHAICIDNWSEFGGPKKQFLDNISNAKESNSSFEFLEKDFRAVDFSKLTGVNIYLFDGTNSEENQYKGIMCALQAWNNESILIVDDYNWRSVRMGTERAIQTAGLRIECSIDIRTTTDDSHPVLCQQNSDWHNGYLIAHLRKQ